MKLLRELMEQAEGGFVVRIQGVGNYEDDDHDGYFSRERGRLIVPLQRAARFPTEQDAVAGVKLATKTLHSIIHDEDLTHDRLLNTHGGEVVVDDNGDDAFYVSIKRI